VHDAERAVAPAVDEAVHAHGIEHLDVGLEEHRLHYNKHCTG